MIMQKIRPIPSYFTPSGAYFPIGGYSDDGDLTVRWPARRNRTGNWFPRSRTRSARIRRNRSRNRKYRSRSYSSHLESWTLIFSFCRSALHALSKGLTYDLRKPYTPVEKEC